MKTHFAYLAKKIDKQGFTLVEVLVSSVIVAFVAAGVWGVYWSVVNTYYVEQRGTNIQAKGERLLDMIANGGFSEGRRVFGLNSMVPAEGYPNVGPVTSINFSDWDDQADDDACDPVDHVAWPDYRIEFVLDAVSGNTRYAEFAIQLYACNPADPVYYSKAILWFRLKTDGTTGTDNDFNYQVKLSENLLQRTDSSDYGDYDKTWFKAQELPSAVSGYCTGVKVSFYLADTSYPVLYNCDLDRELTSPTGNPDQDRSYMSGLPYPGYFSMTVSLPQRN